jgi:hypothetical protein
VSPPLKLEAEDEELMKDLKEFSQNGEWMILKDRGDAWKKWKIRGHKRANEREIPISLYRSWLLTLMGVSKSDWFQAWPISSFETVNVARTHALALDFQKNFDKTGWNLLYNNLKSPLSFIVTDFMQRPGGEVVANLRKKALDLEPPDTENLGHRRVVQELIIKTQQVMLEEDQGEPDKRQEQLRILQLNVLLITDEHEQEQMWPKADLPYLKCPSTKSLPYTGDGDSYAEGPFGQFFIAMEHV